MLRLGHRGPCALRGSKERSAGILPRGLRRTSIELLRRPAASSPSANLVSRSPKSPDRRVSSTGLEPRCQTSTPRSRIDFRRCAPLPGARFRGVCPGSATEPDEGVSPHCDGEVNRRRFRGHLRFDARPRSSNEPAGLLARSPMPGGHLTSHRCCSAACSSIRSDGSRRC